MANSKKLAVLKEKFEILKDKYISENDFHTQYTLVEKIVIPVLQADLSEGMRMWEYLLTKYVNCEHPVDYTTLTNHLVDICDEDVLRKVFAENETIRTHVFKLDPYENHLHCALFIRNLILDCEFDLADMLIQLYLQNDRRENNVQKNLFELLYQTVASQESKWRMTSAGIDYVNKWLVLVDDESKRSELEVCLIDLVDCVENNAPKGAMPFSIFASEGGLDLFMEEKRKQQKSDSQSGSAFDAFMNERKEKKAAVDELTEAEEAGKDMFDVTTLEQCQKELDELIGLKSVKAEVTNLTNLIRVRRIRQERGIAVPETSQHLVFTGNPGTGKTTVARMIGKIYHALGYLSKGHCVEVDRSELVAGYVGQTAIKTQEVIDKAMGGVLFIDEAYSLFVDKSENDFGREAIETLLKEMEDHRDDFVVIVAGYNEPMKKFINSNPGLKSRFNKYVHFPDYTGKELLDIFMLLMKKNQYTVQNELLSILREYFDSLYINRESNFANGREIRNFFEKLVEVQASRIVTMNNPSDEDITTITVKDFLAAGGKIIVKE